MAQSWQKIDQKVEIVKTSKGVEEVVDSGDRRRMNRRLKELRDSVRGGLSMSRSGAPYKVSYKLRNKEIP